MNAAWTLNDAPARRGNAVIAAALAAAAVSGAWSVWSGGQLYLLAGLAGLGLCLVGASWPADRVRAGLLAALLLVPEFVSGHSLGIALRWSAGLTLSNFLLPALALPPLAGLWLGGGRLFARPWPPLAQGYVALLAWSSLTLLAPGLSASGRLTLAAHLGKLLLFVALGAFIAASGGIEKRRVGQWLVAGLAVNAAAGLAQAAGWMPVFSPLASDQPTLGVRASGLFYDANMYGVIVAWGLLWLICRLDRRRGSRRAQLAWWTLGLALAANLVATGSRAGFLAFAAGLLVLLFCRRGKAALIGVGLFLGLAALAPAHSWQRIDAMGHDAGSVERIASMREALRQIERHPLLGVGFGRALYLGVPAIGGGAKTFNGAQNMPLTVWAETGPVGLALLLFALAQPFRRRLPPPMLAGWVGLLAASCTIELLWNARLLALLMVLTV